MKTKIKDYESINKSTQAPKSVFFRNLKKEYGELTKLNILNEQGDNFYFSSQIITNTENEFTSIINNCLKLREMRDINSYLSSGYITSEINSSLKLENIHSSRKKVEAVIKNIKEKKKMSIEEVDLLIANYYQALNFILTAPEINARNLNALYVTVTKGIKDGNFIEEGSFYRIGDVSIGQDKGIDATKVKINIDNLISWIKSSELDNLPHSKAIIAHYVFENIHPYYDFNGRIGRLLHLWILISKFGLNKFWELTFLSEALFSFKDKFRTMFDKILKAKKQSANIDANYPIGTIFDILITHSEAYILMKKIVSEFKTTPSRHIRLFIIDMICWNKNLETWFTILDFKKTYGDYSSSFYDKVLIEIQESNIFDIQKGAPIKFRVKREILQKIAKTKTGN